MSLLDDIHNKAEHKRLRDEDDESGQFDFEKTYQDHINPRLKQVYSYFNTLIADLNYLDEPVSCTYTIPGAGNIDGFLQSGYRIAADNSNRLTDIRISFLLQRNDPVEFSIDSKTQSEQTRDNLHRFKVGFKHQPRHIPGRETGATFTLTGQIPVQIRLFVEPGTIDIILETSNIPVLGLFQKTFKPHEINEYFMEGLGRFLLRQENTLLDEIIGSETLIHTEEEELAQLRKKLKARSRDPAYAQENKAPKPGFFKRLFLRNH